MFLTSAASAGASIIGYEFGGGGTARARRRRLRQRTRPAGLTLGGLVGYNIALVAAAGTSAFWTPSWNQLGWMWGGFGIGEAVSTLVYPFYAATGGDARHGLIFQGVAGSVGASSARSSATRPTGVASEEEGTASTSTSAASAAAA